ncbi:MAG: cyclic nucleotide-binding domain-containing protein [Nitrospinae bacterium]|nr:cyclic nucleotide-binding domain-containing protein [Nitrospinota bacterium]
MSEPLREFIKSFPLFEGVELGDMLDAMPNCAISTFAEGEYILRKGEYSDVCHIIVHGEAEAVFGGAEGNPVFREGDIVGEMALLSGLPRVADIRALTSVATLDITRDQLFALMDAFPAIKERLNEIYRRRGLSGQLARIPLFESIPRSFVDDLAAKAELISFKKDEVVFRQGDPADAFYLLRYGFVKVECQSGGKRRVLAYLKEGHYFGEIALLSDERRSATVSAISRAELIKIPKTGFNELLEAHSGVGRTLENAMKKREERNVRVSADSHFAQALSASVDTGLVATKSILIMDMTLCVHCGQCVAACASMHEGVPRLIRKGIRLDSYTMAITSCMHCNDPSCMSHCPTGAISRDPSGEIHHSDICIGCGSCARDCPYGNIAIIELGPEKSGPGETGQKKARVRKKAVKCDMCKGYTFLGCVYNCPTGAAQRVAPETYFKEFST